MKILSAEQMREWDRYTIQNEPIASIDLMERAASRCSDWIINHFAEGSFKIFCGKGNNGGDGLAIARQLAQHEIRAEVYILEFGKPGTDDFQQNLHRLHEFALPIHYIQSETFFPVISKTDIIIECLYGSGLNRPLDGLAATLVEHINQSKATIVAIDIPAGMFADKSSASNVMINATYTLSFQSLKQCFLLPQNEAFSGNVEVLDIGLLKDFQPKEGVPFELIDDAIIQSIYKPRKKFSHKGTFGHALIIAGSKGKMGASILCSKACLRSGAGLVSSAVPEWGLPIIQSSFPEAMALTFVEVESLGWDSYKSVGIGPGLGTEQEAIDLVKRTLSHFKKPLVIDADGLNILSKHPSWFEFICPGSILSPHPKEFERLFGPADNDFDRLQLALNKARESGIFIILKGHYSFIACPDGKGYFNSTGNAGMATGGSGDVLTGMLTGLLSQGYEPEKAAVLGVYVHGKAGDIAAAKHSQEAMLAGDIIDNLGQAYIDISPK